MKGKLCVHDPPRLNYLNDAKHNTCVKTLEVCICQLYVTKVSQTLDDVTHYYIDDDTIL